MSDPSLRVLFVTPECGPLVKTGGLGDVAASLGRALREAGIDLRWLLPRYANLADLAQRSKRVARLAPEFDFPAAALLEHRGEDPSPLYLLDCPELYARPGGPYQDPASGEDWPDNALRFGLLCRVGALLARDASPLAWRAQLVHCNDWQSGLTPAYLRHAADATAASVMTVHNLAFQGIFDATWLPRLGLPQESFQVEGLEYYGHVSFLKAGLVYSDALSTVSSSYAAEIQSEPLGFGLQGVLHARRGVLAGILNGIDTATWDPASDPLIACRYTAETLTRKGYDKRDLRERCSLAAGNFFLLGMIARLTEQKGVDLVLEALPELLKLPLQLVILGTGAARYEQGLREWAQRFPDRVSVTLGFDERLAHRIEAGADAFLMPSRFEPCGMNQMYSQRYGTPPIAHATGGLIDSIVDCDRESLAQGTATGFLFRDMTVPTLLGAVRHALQCYANRDCWRRVQRAGMAADFTWDASARRYLEVYRKALDERSGAAT